MGARVTDTLPSAAASPGTPIDTPGAQQPIDDAKKFPIDYARWHEELHLQTIEVCILARTVSLVLGSLLILGALANVLAQPSTPTFVASGGLLGGGLALIRYGGRTPVANSASTTSPLLRELPRWAPGQADRSETKARET